MQLLLALIALLSLLEPCHSQCTISRIPSYYPPAGCSWFRYSTANGCSNYMMKCNWCGDKCQQPNIVPKLPPPYKPATCNPYIIRKCNRVDAIVQYKWAYDQQSKFCKFIKYPGCGTHANLFNTYKECSQLCITKDKSPSDVTSNPTKFPRLVTIAQKSVPKGAPKCEQYTLNPCDDFPEYHGSGDKWYFDPEEETCNLIWYQGCGTYSNLFNSQDDCESQCISQESKIFKSPSGSIPKPTSKTIAAPLNFRSSIPLINSTKKVSVLRPMNPIDPPSLPIRTIVTSNQGNFPVNSGRIVTIAQKSVPKGAPKCEQYTLNPCDDFPEYHGSGDKWYFDPEEETCNLIWYQGCGTYSNLFNSQDDCENQCISQDSDRSIVPLIDSTKLISAPNLIPIAPIDPSSLPIGSIATLNPGDNPIDSLEIMILVKPPKCQQYTLGPCDISSENYESANKWHFDPEQNVCNFIWYPGCGAYSNLFDSQADCENQCIPDESILGLVDTYITDESSSIYETFTAPSPTFVPECLPYTIQPCKRDENRENGLYKWFYDVQTKCCKQVWYPGCGAYSNLFDSGVDCGKKCHRNASLEPKCESYSMENCAQETDLACYKWHYDVNENACKFVWYKGCGSYSNLFDDDAQCRNKCIE